MVLAFASWRAAAVTTIQEKENLLHQRWGDSSETGGKVQGGEHHQVKIHSLILDEKTGAGYTLKKYLSGNAEGYTEIMLILNSEYVPDITEFETHPWYEHTDFRVAKIGPRGESVHGDATISLFVYTAEPDEIHHQLQFLGQILDDIVSGRLEDPDSIPDFGDFEFKNIERSRILQEAT